MAHALGLSYLRRVKRIVAALILVLCVGVLAACASAPPPRAALDGPRPHVVHVTSNGWHSAIVVARRDVAATGLLPEAADFPDAAFLEFGWGDREYYPAKDKTVGLALAAAMTPTPAVMHIAGRSASPEPRGGKAEVVALPLTDGELRKLVRAISDEFERPAGTRAEAVAPGLYPGSRFYNAKGTFHLFNTCNTWTARMLQAAGLDMSPSGIVTADELMTRVREAVQVQRPTQVRWKRS